MEQTPKKIYKDFLNNNLDKNSAVDLLTSIIEHSDYEEKRIECVENIGKILSNEVKTNEVFEFLENLVIADQNEKVRNSAITVLRENFLNKAFGVIKFAIKHESDYFCLVNLSETLAEIKNTDSKTILIKQIQRIKKEKYLDKDKKIGNKKYKRALNNLLKLNKLESFSHKYLAEILINFKTISALIKRFYSVYFELKNILVAKLDLADVEYEVRGWKADYKNNIKSISEITGLKNLKYLTHLNLSNNQLSGIQDLSYLKNLTHLYLSNNLIQDIENLKYVKEMSNLKYLDISNNRIADYLTQEDFGTLQVNLKKTYDINFTSYRGL